MVPNELEQLKVVLDCLYTSQRGEPAPEDRLRDVLRSLSNRLAEDETFREVERTLQVGTRELESAPLKDAIQMCNELRMRMIVSAHSFHQLESALRPALPHETETRYDDERDTGHDGVPDSWEFETLTRDVGPVVHCPGGLTYSVLSGVMVILLPMLLDEEQAHGIYSDLLLVEEGAPQSASWIIDCALVASFPTLLLANIVAYAGRLRKVRRELLLYWVRPDSFPEKQLSRMIRFFHLEERGGLMFSRRSVSAR